MGLRRGLWLGTFLCAVLLWGPAAAGEGVGVYVQSAKAKVYEEPSFEAPVRAVLDRGARLTVLERRGRWCLVERDEVHGWVPRILLGEHPPGPKVSPLEDEKAENLVRKARKRASAAAAAGATRGLVSSESRQRGVGSEKPDWEGLKKMESFEVPEEEIEAFKKPLEEGREEE